jgi:4a-hydroxytetrahydrobiopterin dehydratase
MLSRGMIDQSDIDLYTITDDEDEIILIIREAPVRNGIPFTVPAKQKLHSALHPGQEIERDATPELAKKTCVPCEGDAEPFEHDESAVMLSHVNQWTLVEDTSIEKTLHMKDFAEVMRFVNAVATIAQQENHHPDIHIFDYNKIRIVLSTHAIKGLSENDFIMAAKIDEILRGK